MILWESHWVLILAISWIDWIAQHTLYTFLGHLFGESSFDPLVVSSADGFGNCLRDSFSDLLGDSLGNLTGVFLGDSPDESLSKL